MKHQAIAAPQARVVTLSPSTGATLLLAEHYQEAQRLDDAIGLVQQLYQAKPGYLIIKLSLADL